tara:strand:- start:1157 stop:1435 length:279 start_codon:yes stop_codon:yes gene_type:complete
MAVRDKKSRNPKIKIGISIPRDVHEEAKQASIQLKMTFSAFCRVAFEGELDRLKKLRDYQSLINEAAESNVPLVELKRFIESKKSEAAGADV